MASITDGLIDDPSQTTPPKKGTFLGDVKRGVGNMLTTSARAAQDVGINLPSINAYGQQLVNENPAEVNSGADILSKPLTTVREAVGENAPQIGTNIATGKAGQVIGGAIGAGVGALTRNPANIARFEQIGQRVGGTAGFAAPTFVQEYGTIRQGQDETGQDDRLKAALGATVATGLEQLGESKVAKRLFKVGGEQAVQQAGKSVLGDVAREAGKTALVEGATEAAQTGVERISSGQNLGDQDAQNDFLVSAAKGAVGGAGFGGAARGAEHVLGRVEQPGQPAAEAAPVPAQVQQQAAEGAPVAVQPPGPTPAAVVNPADGPLSRAVTAGVDSGDVVGVQVAGRASIPDGSVAPVVPDLPPDVVSPPAISAPAEARPTLDQLTDFRPEAKPPTLQAPGDQLDAAAMDAPNFGLPEAPRTLPDDHPLLQPTIEHDTPERQQLRQAIVDQHFADATPAPADRAPIAYVMGGGGASGKGTILDQLKERGVIPAKGAVEIDPDRIKTGAEGFQGLPEYQQLLQQGDSRAAAVVHEESSHVAGQTLDQAMAGRYDMVLDRTLGDPAKGAAELQALKNAGYEVRLYGVTVDPQQAVARAVSRAQRSGRYVPLNALLKAHRGFASAFENYANIADSAELFDNDVKRGESPVLLASKGENGLEVLHPERYNNFQTRSGINEAATTLREINPAAAATPERGAAEGARSVAVPGDRGNDQAAGAAGAAAEVESAGGVPAERLSGPAFAVQPNGSALIEGDRRQLAAQLKTAGIPHLPATHGVRVAARYVEDARAALAPAKGQAVAARASVAPEEMARGKAVEATPAAGAQGVSARSEGAGPVRGGAGRVAEPRGADSRLGSAGRQADGSLAGLPRIRTPNGSVASADAGIGRVAEQYMASRGEVYTPPATYARGLRDNAPAAVERAQRIATAFDAMEHNPQDPETARAYQAMIDETKAQYQAMLDNGLKVEFIDYAKQGDPYQDNPWGVHDDVRNNNHMWVFSTRDGFGTDQTFDPKNNPLLQDTGFTDANGQPMLANDVFRAVHDYFGHVKEGVGFRADGEENAWRAHAAMYSPLARRAMTTETRGQNSWLNYGPHGEANRSAKTGETVFADQKIGLLPEWVSEEGRHDEVRASLGQGAKQSMPYPRVQGEVGRLTKRWKGGPSVQVVPTFDALPEQVRAHLDPRADAAYDGAGTIYVVGDRMGSGADIRRVLAHEAYAHYGVKGLLGPQFENFLGRVGELKDTDPSVRKAADAVYQKYGELDPEAEADEIVAHLAEHYGSLTGRAKILMARVIAAAKDFVRNRLGLNLQWSSNDVLDMVARAKRQVLDGGAESAPTDAVAAAIRASVPPSQMQSFNGWTIPSDKLADHLAAAAGSRLKAYQSVAGAKGDALRGLLQDYFLPVKRVQEAIQARGGQISEDADVYGREELYYGRTGEQLRQLEEEHVKPLVREMAKQGISQQDLELYLYAKFAPERNARIAAINPKMPDGGSGMTNADAAQIISDFQRDGKAAKLDALAQRVQSINAIRLDALEQGGLLDPGEAAMWRQEKNYVPLKGLAAGVQDDTGTRLPVGGGFSVGGKEAWRALGRKSRATDILANTVAQTEQAIIRAEKNRVAQALLKLAQNNPNDRLWSVDKTISKPTFDKATGEVKYNHSAVEPNAVIAKVGGEEHRINLYDKRLLDAVKNMGAAKVGAILRAFSSVNRFLSLTRTTLAPEFVLSNFARDLQTAAVNLGGEQSAGLAAKTVRDVPLAVRAVWGLRRGKLPSGEWGRWAREFADSGALTSFIAQRTVEEQQSKIQSLLKEAQGGVAGSSRQLVRATLDLVEDANGAIENGTRLSAYANARREGMSVQEAARLAKNLTVNFNRKGSAGSAINAMYLFYNASIQGTHRFLRAMKSPKVQATMAATALLGFGLGFYNRAVGGKDDDGEDKWDKVQDWEKARNLIIMHSDGSTTKIPMPYTYNLPFLLGSQMSDMVFGKKKASDGAANMVNALIDAFNPVGNVDFKGDMTEQVAKLSTPSAAAPFLDLALNKNHFGGPIMPEVNPYDKVKDPDSERFFASTNPAAVAFARELNRITGGNKVKPGAIDISPASMTYIFDYLTGGTGSFFDRVGTSVGLAVKGEKVPANKIPFLRVFRGELDDNRVNDTYYKARDDANQKFEMARLAAKPGGFTDATAEERQEMALGRRLAGPLRTAEFQLKKVNEAMKYAKAHNDDARVKELKERQRQIMLRFNTVYFRAKEDFSESAG